MCGILGVSVLNKNTKPIVPFLAWAMQERGEDSWGASNGRDVIRHMGPIRRGFYLPQKFSGRPVIIHTRKASRGSITIANAHPYEIGNIIGIHNGTLTNPLQLNTLYNRAYESDTPHLFHNINEGLDLTEFSGSAVMAWFNKTTKNSLYLCRVNHTALSVVKLKSGETVFASEHSAIQDAVSMGGGEIDKEYQIDEGMVYVLNCVDHKLYATNRSYKFKTFQASTYVACGGNRFNYYNHHDDWEQKPNLRGKKICGLCFKDTGQENFYHQECLNVEMAHAGTVLKYSNKQMELLTANQND